MQTEDLGLHHHANLLYDAPSEVLRQTGLYLARGLATGELCVYVTDDDVDESSVRTELRDRFEVDVAAKERDGQLLILGYRDAYLSGSAFDAARMLSTWRDVQDLATAKDFRGVRTVGGTTWNRRHPAHLDELLNYEEQVDHLFATLPFGAICTYNRNHLSLTDTLETLDKHPVALLNGRGLTNDAGRGSWNLEALSRLAEGMEERMAFLHVVDLNIAGDLVEARETVRSLATLADFPRMETTAVLAAASELGRNVLVHAGTGVLAVGLTSPSGHLVLGTFDDGPGIPRVDLALKDGFSTIGSLGMGLPGSKRVMDRFELQTEVGHGTQVLAAKYR